MPSFTVRNDNDAAAILRHLLLAACWRYCQVDPADSTGLRAAGPIRYRDGVLQHAARKAQFGPEAGQQMLLDMEPAFAALMWPLDRHAPLLQEYAHHCTAPTPVPVCLLQKKRAAAPRPGSAAPSRSCCWRCSGLRAAAVERREAER